MSKKIEKQELTQESQLLIDNLARYSKHGHQSVADTVKAELEKHVLSLENKIRHLRFKPK